MIIADVTFPDQAVDGPLIRVSAVPQYTAVVETKFVFGIRWKSRAQGPGGRLECYENITFARLDAWRQGLEVFLPSVRGGTAHVLLKPGLKISKLMLHSVYDLHGCVQVSTTQAIIDHRPDWVALDLTILLPAQILNVAVEPSFIPSSPFGYIHHAGVTALVIQSLLHKTYMPVEAEINRINVNRKKNFYK